MGPMFQSLSAHKYTLSFNCFFSSSFFFSLFFFVGKSLLLLPLPPVSSYPPSKSRRMSFDLSTLHLPPFTYTTHT
uniref:Ovule protein n=1 Tax=Caenorhabditis tropicalis TaxID=1561998 RepID=A0A1I7UAS1_9PELO